jgi:hypothetical protein
MVPRIEVSTEMASSRMHEEDLPRLNRGLAYIHFLYSALDRARIKYRLDFNEQAIYESSFRLHPPR